MNKQLQIQKIHGGKTENSEKIYITNHKVQSWNLVVWHFEKICYKILDRYFWRGALMILKSISYRVFKYNFLLKTSISSFWTRTKITASLDNFSVVFPNLHGFKFCSSVPWKWRKTSKCSYAIRSRHCQPQASRYFILKNNWLSAITCFLSSDVSLMRYVSHRTTTSVYGSGCS